MDRAFPLQGILNQALLGVWNSVTLIDAKKSEDIYSAGKNHTWTAIFQTVQVSFVVELIDFLAKHNIPISPPSTFVRVSGYAIPLVTAALWSHSDFIENPILRQSIFLLHTHIGTICQIAGIVSSIVLIIFDQPIVGITSIVMFSIALLKRTHKVSPQWQGYCDRTLSLSINGAYILLGKWRQVALTVMMTVCDFGLFTWNEMTEKKAQQKLFDRELTVYGIEDIQNQSVDIDQEHVVSLESELTASTDNSLNDLNDLLASIPLEDEPYCSTIHRKLFQDDDWKQHHTLHPQADEKEYIRQGIKQFIYNLEHRCIPTGAPVDYDALIAKSKSTISLLKHQPPLELASGLFDLAICSYYCSTGYVREVYGIHNALFGTTHELSLRYKILRILAKEREYIIQEIYSEILSMKLFFYLYEKTGYFRLTDVHHYGILMNMFGDQLGLPSQEIADQDTLAQVNSIDKSVYNILSKPSIYLFWKIYSITRILERIQFAIDGQLNQKNERINREIDASLVSQWLKDMCEKDEIQDLGAVFDKTGAIQSPYIELLLVNLGVLKITK